MVTDAPGLLQRRAVIAGLVAAAASPAAAATTPFPPVTLASSVAYRQWETRAKVPRKLARDSQVTTAAGAKLAMAQWFDGKPAIFVLWASWCPPCLAESPELAKLQKTLIKGGYKTRVRALHAYDDMTFPNAVAKINRLGSAGLDSADASAQAEKTFIQVFGESPKEKGRTSLPALMLVSADGYELARQIGTFELPGKKSYWDRPATLQMLRALDALPPL
ncbi:hypothetical protein BH11PSE2_BH11PSE2_02110 [soil metagenome]